jgi:hypothetical protein
MFEEIHQIAQVYEAALKDLGRTPRIEFLTASRGPKTYVFGVLEIPF